MTQEEMVTQFKLREQNRQPVTVELLLRELDRHLKAKGLEADYYGFDKSLLPYRGERIPENPRWLVAFAVDGENEGYYIHVGAIEFLTLEYPRRMRAGTYQDLGFAKTAAPDRAYAIAHEAQRFLTAAMWN